MPKIVVCFVDKEITVYLNTGKTKSLAATFPSNMLTYRVLPQCVVSMVREVDADEVVIITDASLAHHLKTKTYILTVLEQAVVHTVTNAGPVKYTAGLGEFGSEEFQRQHSLA